MSEFQIKKAQRAGKKIKVYLAGPSGSGKTKGALWFARAFLGPEGRICVIDTERESASFYAGEPGIGDFDVLPLDAPYHTDRYVQAIETVVAAKYDLVIIDSITHQWSGVGGILERKEETDTRGGNNFTNWAKFTPETTRFRNALLEAHIHLIATVRSKQEFVIGDGGGDQKGKVRKVGMKPEQRDGLEYEFSLAWQLQMDNKAEVLKDRTSLFAGKLVDLRNPKIAQALRAWVDSGAPEVSDAKPDAAAPLAPTVSEPAPTPAPAQAPVRPTGACGLCQEARSLTDGLCDECRASVQAEKELEAAKALPLAGKETSWQVKGLAYGTKPIGTVPSGVLKQAGHFFKEKNAADPKAWMQAQIEAISLVLADREKDQTALDFPETADENASGSGEPATAAPIDTTLKPGAQQDALTLDEDEQRARPTSPRKASTTPSAESATETSRVSDATTSTANATADPEPRTMPELAAAIGDLLNHPDMQEDDRKHLRGLLRKANTVDELRDVYRRAVNAKDLPF